MSGFRALGAFSGGAAQGLSRGSDIASEKQRRKLLGAADEREAAKFAEIQAEIDAWTKQNLPTVSAGMQPPAQASALPGPAAQTFPLAPREDVRPKSLMPFQGY